MKNDLKEALFVEHKGKKYIILPLCLFHDISTETRNSVIMKQFGLKDICTTRSLYEITDERKLMLLKIKYNV